MDYKDIRNYWDSRASSDTSAQSTTNDIYLREIECRAISEQLQKHKPQTVADFGCGDGLTTLHLSTSFPQITFLGIDYAQSMIANANTNLEKHPHKNISFLHHDIMEETQQTFDLIYTTRCLINLPTFDLQKKALQNIHRSLHSKGIYIMVENFIEGHNNFNNIRKDFNLPPIPLREHNLFFQRDHLLEFLSPLFHIEHEINISSTYYLMSRIIYSKLCSDTNSKPDYFDDHHKYAAQLPFAGEYGPVRLICLSKM